MKKLDKISLRKLILKEMKKMEEDYLVKPGTGKDTYYDHENTCEQCGSKASMYEGECSECGYSMYEKEEKEKSHALNEGDCGCASDCDCRKVDSYESGDYDILNYDCDHDFIPDHMHSEYENDVLTPGEAFGLGIKIAHHDDSDVKIGNHKHYKGSYMAKNHMYKTAKYAQKLYEMIPDGHNLEDWMRSKLAQIADDISEVYHALDHDIFEGDV